MRIITALLFVLVLPVLAFANSAEETIRWNSAEIEWLSFEEGSKVAQQNGRPMLVVFHATWCPHCRRYRKQFFDPTVVELSQKLIMVLVDVDLDRDVFDRYRETGRYVPKTVALTPAAVVMTNVSGRNKKKPHSLSTNSPKDIIRFMEKALK